MTMTLDALITEMTLSEKIKLLGGWRSTPGELRDGDVYGVPRLGVSPLRLADGPIGVHWWTEASTCYPALIGLAASFDEDAAYAYGRALGTDCRAFGVHVVLAPGVNLYRSPLCGRNFEYLGEDPELAGGLAAAYIRGVQSKGVAATVKHFAANNQEYDRHTISSDLDERTLREVYLRPFERAVCEGHVGAVMTAYNPVNGQHASENAWLLDEVLRGNWGFTGWVMSDWTSVYSTVQTLNSGLDVEMPFAVHLTEEKIKSALDVGVTTLDRIDRMVRHRLALMERFGWLVPGHEQRDKTLPDRNPETEAVALDVARRGIVLLKNENEVLPCPPSSIRRMVVLGHHAAQPILSGGGSAACPPHESVTLLDALRKVYGEQVQIDYYEMVDPWREQTALETTTFYTDEGVPGLKASYFKNNQLEGAPVLERVDPRLKFRWISEKPDPALADTFFSARWTGYFDIDASDDYDWYLNSDDGTLQAWVDEQPITSPFTGTQRIPLHLTAGRHRIEVVYCQLRGGWATCRCAFERASNAFHAYEAGLAAAAEADLVVATTGFLAPTESEARDRMFELDSRLDKMVQDAAQHNDRTIVVLYAGGAVDVGPWVDRVPGFLSLWYPGQNGTLAAAEIMAGLTNPSGKLPFTWEYRLEDRGSFHAYHDEDKDKRVAYTDGVFTGYRWFDREQVKARYPFGHGLSYTTFTYEKLICTPDPVLEGDTVRVTFDVVNTGNTAGRHAALLFVAPPPGGMVPRPIKEFKRASVVDLAPGERQSVTVTLPWRAFQYWHPDARAWTFTPGVHSIQIRPDAERTGLEAEVRLAQNTSTS